MCAMSTNPPVFRGHKQIWLDGASDQVSGVCSSVRTYLVTEQHLHQIAVIIRLICV